MTPPGPGGRPVGAPYAGPPPTLRPEPGRFPLSPWPQAGGTAPAPVVWPPPPGTPPHDEPRLYLLAMRARDWAWWRPLAGLGLLGVAAVVIGALLGVVGILTGVRPAFSLLGATDPVVLLLTNATLAVAVPVVWLAWAVAHGMRPGWSSSVRARLRRRLLPRLVLLATLAAGTVLGLLVLVSVPAGGGEIEGPVRSWGWLLVVVLLTTPVRAAAEEYLFRGYLSQAVAGWAASRTAGAVAAAVVTAALFSLVHLPPDLPTFLARFAFGLAASVVVVLTGGLEAAIALHVVTDVLVLLLAGLLGPAVVAAALSGPVPAAIGLAGLGGYVALVAWWRRGAQPETRTSAMDLRPPAPEPAPAH
ncbi:CPBP family intramembrane glutamic endopeptidase [Blastococcus capsensis]|uniref:CPBP family intramembrane glutamic endopeptidase n=1 Tax=Blastococcus capsensis TaxID=1564163 RepID=UPI002541EE9A|nr:CPBP family intramembrane glutamic endopeptidase [Blastococcus capsensis]MDK3257704.1 CPBP family intramembrane metalloprotease [Blastococcus capsensis]